MSNEIKKIKTNNGNNRGYEPFKGYQPIHGHLDTSNPPRGGSGVPPKEQIISNGKKRGDTGGILPS